jgi:hypothetical protein
LDVVLPQLGLIGRGAILASTDALLNVKR